MPVYNIGGRKINAESQAKAQYLYDKEWGAGAKGSSSSSSSSSTRTTTPTSVAPPAPTSSYSGGSIVDYLRSAGQASDFNSRSALAAKSGIQGYTGSAAQNTQLLNAIRTRPTTPTTPKDTFISNQREGLQNASNLSATTPEKTDKQTTGTPDYRKQYVDFLTSAYPMADVQGARASLSALQKRIADTTLTTRHEDDRIRQNESGALARGIEGQLGENSRVSARELGDLGIAAAPLTSVLEGAEGAYRTLAGMTPTEQDAFTLSQGQTRYEKQPDGSYKAVGTVGKVGDPLGSLSSTGSIKSGNLDYTRNDYTEDSTALENSRGTDGWVDPSVYQTLYKNWISSGGTADDFVSLYPPERYANPANDWLPGVLRNGSGSSARTQVVEIGGRRVLINVDTGDTIRDLGVALGTGDGGGGWGL